MTGADAGAGAGSWLAERAALSPGQAGLICEGEELSWAELDGRVERVARRLVATGLSRGESVALLASPSIRFVELIHAAQRAGLVVITMNDRLTASELGAQLELARPAVVLHDVAHADAARRLRSRHDWLQTMEVGDELDRVDAGAAVDWPAVEADATLTVIFTSGTSGSPKGVMLSNGNHRSSAHAAMTGLGVERDDRWLVVLPLYHVGGLSILFRAVLFGVTVVLQREFDAVAAVGALSEQRVTIVSLVAAMLTRMLDVAGEQRFPDDLRCVLLGGGPTPAGLVQRCRRLRVPAVTSYGLTETGSQVAAAALAEHPASPPCSGHALAGVELRIADPDGSGCGEILVRGPQVMTGYLARPDLTAAALADGWLHTGDLGRLDDRGGLHVATRREDLIVTGGENVVPDEVEAVLAEHAGVDEVGVFALEDPRWGQVVAAAIVAGGDRRVDGEALVLWCRRRLAGYKVPRRLFAVGRLPRTAAGKLQRGRLAREVATSGASMLDRREWK